MRIDGSAPIPLESFRRIEGQDGQVGIVHGPDGEPHVIATGRSSEGREVSWVRPVPNSLEHDVVGRFVEAISHEFGQRITDNITRELGLKEVSGSLDTRTVERAVHMAETQRDVFSGANIFLEIHCSAMVGSPAFRQALEEIGGPPSESIGQDVRAQIDERLRVALTKASDGNRMPLTVDDGERILRDVLRDLFGNN